MLTHALPANPPSISVQASEPILSLVGGLSAQERVRCAMVMIVDCYSDESGGDDTGQMVMGGFAATPSAWSEIANDWDAILKGPPDVDYWHMKEAYGRNARIERLLGVPERDTRLVRLAHLLPGRVLRGQTVAMSRWQYDRYFQPAMATRPLDGMWFICFAVLLQRIGFNLAARDDIEQVYLYLEPAKGRTALAQAAFDEFMDTTAPAVLQDKFFMHPLVGRGKAVKRTYKPLQAADMLVWHEHKARKDMKERNRPVLRHLLAGVSTEEHEISDWHVKTYWDVFSQTPEWKARTRRGN